MPFHLTEEQELVRSSVREFAEAEIKPLAPILDKEHRPPLETIPKLAEMGILGMMIPEEYGGTYTNYLSFIIAEEEVARCCGTTAVMMEVHSSLISSTFLKYGNEEQKRKYLPKLASGEMIGAFCLTEAGAGSDAGAMTSTAVRDGDEWVINGQKIFITNASFAGLFLVMARSTDAPGTKGVSAFLVEADTPGITVATPENKMGIRGSATCQVTFNDVRVPLENLFYEEGKGFHVAMGALDGGRTGIAAQALGIAQGAYDIAVEYAKTRVQFGKPIASLQAIQWMIAEMATDLEAGRALVYQAADLEDRGLPFAQEAAMAKLFCGEMSERVTSKAIQVLGGNGYIEEYQVERMYRDARITQIYEGTNEIQKLVISRNALR
jgi:alkylation response protein AidB-like acyl-CoA dehydrogenase